MPFIGKQSTSNSQITSYTTTVGSGGQTNFTVVIEGGDETHVYLNGVLLKETTDYTVSSTQVSLVSPAVENDIVEVKVFRSFALVDAVKATGGTFSGDVTVPNLIINDGGNIGSASDTDAISIASNGKPTFSAGIANTGTIDAGTFNGTIGSSATFPFDGTADAGRVLQVKYYTSQETNNLVDDWTVRWNYSVTLKSGSSRIMVLHTENTYVDTGGYGVKVYRNNSVYNDSVTTITGTAVYNKVPLNSSGKSHMVHSSSGGIYTVNPINFIDDVSSSYNAGDTVYYGHYYSEYSGTAQVPAGGDGSNHGAFITLIMELEK